MPERPVRALDILFVAPVALPGAHGIGGVQRIVSRQARWLAARGHRVRVLTSRHPSGQPSLHLDGVSYLFVDLEKGLGVASAAPDFTVARWRAVTSRAWPDVLCDGVPDLVHGHAEGELGLVRAGLVGGVGQPPVVSTLYGSGLAGLLDHARMPGGAPWPAEVRQPRSRRAGMWLRSARAAARGAAGVVPTFASARSLRVARVVALSERHARLVRWSYGARRVTVIPPGVDTVVYHPAAAAIRAALRRRFGVPADAFVWGVVGRVAPGKGVDVALRALAVGQRIGDGVGGVRSGADGSTVGGGSREDASATTGDWLLVAGSGPAESESRELADKLGVGARVAWVGDVDPPALAYHCLDALLLPTGHEESFGLAALEAMSCGVPVIASARGALPEVVADAGLLVDGRSPAEWARAMGSLRVHDQTRIRMARSGRDRALGRYSRAVVTAKLERLYDAARSGSR